MAMPDPELCAGGLSCIHWEHCDLIPLSKECVRHHEARGIKRTNGDKIRAMSDEVLAEFICNTDFCELLCPNSAYCDKGDCNIRMLAWLRQEANNGN